MLDLPLISIAILLPLMSALYINLFISHSNTAEQKQIYATYVAILSAVLTLIVATALVFGFNNQTSDLQFVERYNWVPEIGLEFYVGIDGLSVFFIFLTALLTLVCIISSLFTIKKLIKEFLLCLLLLESFCIGVFTAQNLLLFYGFFEIILIPMYLVIGIWGGKDRIYAAVKFFLYTFFGSLFLLLAMIYIYTQVGTFSIPDLAAQLPYLPVEIQKILFLATFFAFAIKVPMLPFHTWLPLAHVQAPTAGSVMLAGILLKLGGYAMLRISLPFFPLAAIEYSSIIMLLSAVAVVYGSFVALAQTDMKKMIAYSSVAHMGYVTCGIFSFSLIGISGACFQMISHGLISSALFLIVGILYERGHTKNIYEYGGVAAKMPSLALLFMVAMLGSIGLPGTSGFIGEFLSIVGVFEVNMIFAVICTLGVIFGAVYMLKLYKLVMLGVASREEINNFPDLYLYEKASLTLLAFLIIYLGLNPNFILRAIEPASSQLIKLY